MYWFLIMIWTILIILVNTLWFYVVNLYYILVTCLLENAVILRGEFTDWSCWFSCRLTYLEFTVKQVWNDFDFVSVHVVTSTSFYCMFLGTIWLHFVTKLEQTDLSWFITNKIQVYVCNSNYKLSLLSTSQNLVQRRTNAERQFSKGAGGLDLPFYQL